MRRKRLYFGIPLALIALLLLLRVQFAERSQEAIINGKLATLETPIRGFVENGSVEPGQRVREGESLGSVTDPLFDDHRLRNRVYEREVLVARIEQQDRQMKHLRRTLERLEERQEIFHRLKIEELSAELRVREARLAAARARAELAREDLRRLETLVEEEAGVRQERDRAEAEATAAEEAIQEEQARADALRTRRRAHREGLSIEPGQDDLSSTEQRIYDLRRTRSSLGEQLIADRARLRALDREIREERRHRRQQTQYTFRSTVPGRVWAAPAEDGELVRAGDPLLEIVDCSSILVTVSVRRSVYNQLREGDPALFFPPNSAPRLEGEVLVRYGDQASGLDGRFASNLPVDRDEGHFIVAVKVPGLEDHPELACAVGRTGRVYFEDGPVGWLRRFLG